MSMSAKSIHSCNEHLRSQECCFLFIRERDLKVSWTIRYDLYIPSAPRISDKGILNRDTQEIVNALREVLEEKCVIIDQMRGKIFTTFNPSSDSHVFTILDGVSFQEGRCYTIETQGTFKSRMDFLSEAIPDPQIFFHPSQAKYSLKAPGDSKP